MVSKPPRPLSFRPREQFEIDTVLPGTTLLEEWVPPSRGHAIAGRRQSLREAAFGMRFRVGARRPKGRAHGGESFGAQLCCVVGRSFISEERFGEADGGGKAHVSALMGDESAADRLTYPSLYPAKRK